MKTSTLVISVGVICATFTTLQVMPVMAVDQNATKATITKSVQNQTTNSAVAAADTKEDALQAKTGDILKYVIELKNNSDKELKTIKITDSLPAGVELVSNSAQRTITEEIAAIKAGESVTKQIIVKVTAGKDGDIIDNQACFTATLDSETTEQHECNSAAIRIGEKPAEQQPAPAPTKPETEAKPEAKPTETPQPAATAKAEDLPTTGPSDVIAPLAAISTGALGYLSRLLVLKRRTA